MQAGAARARMVVGSKNVMKGVHVSSLASSPGDGRTAEAAVPAGFAHHPRSSPLTDPWQPIYSKQAAEGLVFGLRAARPHTNARGSVHGGLISALADNVMGYSCVARFAEPVGMVTVHLSVDFLDAVAIGQWLEFAAAVIKTGKTLCVAQCAITADGVPAARADATFRVVPR